MTDYCLITASAFKDPDTYYLVPDEWTPWIMSQTDQMPENLQHCVDEAMENPNIALDEWEINERDLYVCYLAAEELTKQHVTYIGSAMELAKYLNEHKDVNVVNEIETYWY